MKTEVKVAELMSEIIKEAYFAQRKQRDVIVEFNPAMHLLEIRIYKGLYKWTGHEYNQRITISYDNRNNNIEQFESALNTIKGLSAYHQMSFKERLYHFGYIPKPNNTTIYHNPKSNVKIKELADKVNCRIYSKGQSITICKKDYAKIESTLEFLNRL